MIKKQLHAGQAALHLKGLQSTLGRKTAAFPSSAFHLSKILYNYLLYAHHMKKAGLPVSKPLRKTVLKKVRELHKDASKASIRKAIKVQAENWSARHRMQKEDTKSFDNVWGFHQQYQGLHKQVGNAITNQTSRRG